MLKYFAIVCTIQFFNSQQFLLVNAADTAAQYESYHIIETVSEALRRHENAPILMFMHKNLSYHLCGTRGNYESFPSYLENQEKTLINVRFDMNADDAAITKKDGKEFLTFSVNTEAIYTTTEKIQGSATVLAVREPTDISFKILEISQRCRILTKRHRLYRLFTYHDLYDY